MFEGIEDFLAIRVLLVTKLVCGKGQDHEVVSVLLAEVVHLREVTGCRASQRGRVFNKDDLAFEV